MYVILLLVFVVWLLYKWTTSDHDHFAKQGVPNLEPVPVFGNALRSTFGRESVVDLFTRSYNKFKQSKIHGMFSFNQISYVLTDPELIKQLTIKDFDHFINHNEMVSEVDRVFGKTLFGMRGQVWKDMRSTLSPIFTSSKMKAMYGLLYNHVQDFLKHFEKKTGNGTVDIDALEIFSRFTADGITNAVLGFEGDCVKNDDSALYDLCKEILHGFASTQAILKFIIAFLAPKVYSFFEMQIISKKTTDFFRRVVIDVMKERERTNVSRPDVIQLMHNVRSKIQNKEALPEGEEDGLKANLKNLEKIVDDDEYWLAQGFIFFLGGFDTTSHLLQGITLELALNPEIQDELYQEIIAVNADLDDKPVSYDILHNMKFLDMVISEALRKHPPFVQMDRTCSKDYNLDLGNGKNVLIKKGELVVFPYYQLHRDAEYFPDPEKFDPYRFSDENKDSIVSGTYIPFGLGPRACIGSRFVLMEVKLLMFHLLLNFEIKKCARTPEKLTYEQNLAQRILQRVYLNFVKRIDK
ncbi:Cytochrome P450 9e2 [Pseudolycoriella hygida]|uniref:Cytochrome P450 9e2 n=1 Tax=Pseudolycoriella hygida TaxID=35572 RepID=A0A9Q0NEC4_9DIPT|nr:Cytochrome P450 9e2 [Pseudolycoriella hygida]